MTAAVLAVILASNHALPQETQNPIMQGNKPPTGPLPLPPVGTELGIFGPWERGSLAAGKEPSVNAKATDVQIQQFTAKKVADPYGTRGMLEVDVILSKPARDHYVDIYISGYYVGLNGELEGVKNVGRRPAYEFKRVDYVDHNKHPGKEPNRRYAFRIPDVLPAKVRVELYQITVGKAARLIAKKETGFDTDWKDYGVIEGHLYGQPGKSVTRARFLVEPGTESVSIRVPSLKPIKPDDYSNDLSISLNMKGDTVIEEKLNKNIEGREFIWKATAISAGPSLLDRDSRNNLYWPHLKGAGYLDIPPIRAGNAPLVKYP